MSRNAGVFAAALTILLAMTASPLEASVPKALVLEHFDYPS